MKKLNLILVILIASTILSCSSDDNNEVNPQINFFNNAYLEIYTTDGTTCYADLFLTDGTASVNSNNEVSINSDNTNVIVFNSIKMDNCELNNPNIKIWDLENGIESELNSMFLTEVKYDIDFANQTYNLDYSEENIIYSKLTMTSTGLTFEIELIDGAILSDTYNGNIVEYDSTE